MTKRNSRLRSTAVVVSACHSTGRSVARSRTSSISAADSGASAVRWSSPYRGQRRIPPLLERARHQAVLGVDRIILALRQARVIARPLEAELPLPVDRPALVLQALERHQHRFDPGRLDRIQKGAADGLVDVAHRHGLALWLTIGVLSAAAVIARRALSVAHPHLPATTAAADQPGQQGRSVTRRTAALLREVVAIVGELPAVGPIGVEAQIGWVDVRHHDVPRLRREPPIDEGWWIAGHDLPLGAAVDEGAGIGGIDQHAVEHLIGWA